MKANYHTHVSLCRHAGGEPIDYVKAAIDNKMDILGFSDHAPFEDTDYGYRMLYSELSKYCDDVDKVKEIYKDKLTVYRGLEIEYLTKYDKTGSSYYQYLFDKVKMDYLLLGEHFFLDSNGIQHNIFFAEDSNVVLEYAKACVQAMKTGYFKILAHPDLFGINNIPWDSNTERASEIIIQGAIDNDVVLECNANGRRRGIQEYSDGARLPYPMDKFWQKVKEAKAKCIVGSDCHSVDVLWDNQVQGAFDYLKDLDITPLPFVKL